MANSINATSTGNGGIITTGDDSGVLNIQTNETTAISIDASQSVDFTNNIDAPNTFGFKNRLINGNMIVSQRYAAASSTVGSGSSTVGNYYGYYLDRWFAQSYSSAAGNGFTFTTQQNQGSVTPPAGFSNYLGVTVTYPQATLSNSALFVGARQYIEGFNTADLALGTANAKALTLSFWVRSSVTGTYAVNLLEYNSTATFQSSYVINAANTWEQKTIAVPACTVGTWAVNNTASLGVDFILGASADRTGGTANTWVASGGYNSLSGCTNLAATNGATWQLTGVQLEKGTQATSFDFRSYGTELALCQRYYTKSFNTLTAPLNGSSTTTFPTYYGIYTSVIDRPSTGGPATANDSTTAPNGTYGSLQVFPVTMRTNPSVTFYGNSNGNWWVQGVGSGGATWYGPQGYMPSVVGFTPTFASPISTDSVGIVFGHWAASAEL